MRRNFRQWITQLRGNHDGLAVSLHDLDEPSRMHHSVSPTNNAVICQEHRIVLTHKWQNRLCELNRARRFVRSQSNRTNKDLLLRDQIPLRNDAGNCMCGCVRRMAVNYGSRLRNGLIDFKVKKNLARLWTLSVDLAVL